MNTIHLHISLYYDKSYILLLLSELKYAFLDWNLYCLKRIFYHSVLAMMYPNIFLKVFSDLIKPELPQFLQCPTYHFLLHAFYTQLFCPQPFCTLGPAAVCIFSSRNLSIKLLLGSRIKCHTRLQHSSNTL